MRAALACALFVWLSAACAQGAGDYAGKFENPKLSVEMVADAGGYVGQIHMGQEQFPLKARWRLGGLPVPFRARAMIMILRPRGKGRG